MLELGAGTGKLTRVLLPHFDRVVALEPAPPMRRVLAQTCPDVDMLAGEAEAIPAADASVDAVFVAEAFHRFDRDRALAEIGRVLRSRGTLVLLWNLPAAATVPSVTDAERFLLEWAPEGLLYDPVDLNTKTYSSGDWRDAFDGAPFEPLHHAELPNQQAIDRDDLVSFYASMGWIADMPDDERLRLLDDVRARLRHDAYVRHWTSHVHWARKIG